MYSGNATEDLGDLVYVLILARRKHGVLRRRRDLAAHLGVAVSTLNDWEAGRDAPTLLHLIRWARVFNLRLTICSADGDYPLTESVADAEQAWDVRQARRLFRTLTEIRNRLPMTQLELARRLEVTDATVLRWEHGRRHPRLLALLRWTRELGCVVQLRGLNPS
ncbi:transcriptional regulator with XRE-family HTH domain [Catenulispora sp. GP43]|uniref:helix-turn-helix domain-containing protein n=1 Tax=Catenulispora sp. GP43 TaxID=3156263 RepID=UPI00351328DB